MEKDFFLDKYEERRGGVRIDMGVIGEFGYVGLVWVYKLNSFLVEVSFLYFNSSC